MTHLLTLIVVLPLLGAVLNGLFATRLSAAPFGRTFVTAVGCGLPILSFLIYSFWSVENHQIIRQATLANYAAFFGNDTYVGVFFLTLLLCAKVTLAGLVVGYPLAYFLWRQNGSRRYLLLLLFILFPQLVMVPAKILPIR